MDKRKQRVKPSPEVVRAVWEAEDGRCEACGRPMDKRCADVALRDKHAEPTAENVHLLCVDCKARRPDLLTQLVVSPEVEEQVARHLGNILGEGDDHWLLTQLQRYGVIIHSGKQVRTYWLPGIGRFRVAPQEDGTAVVIGVEKLHPQPQLKRKPQERTRGLPKPDRSPRPESARGPKGQAKAPAAGTTS